MASGSDRLITLVYYKDTLPPGLHSLTVVPTIYIDNTRSMADPVVYVVYCPFGECRPLLPLCILIPCRIYGKYSLISSEVIS